MCVKKQWKLTCLKGSVNEGGRTTPEREHPEQAMLECFPPYPPNLQKPAFASAFELKRYSLAYWMCPFVLKFTAVHYCSCNCKYVTQPTPDCIPPSSSLFSFLWVSVIFKEPGLSHVSPGVTVVLSRKWSEKNEGKWRRAKRTIYPIFLSFFGQFIQQILSASSVLSTRQCVVKYGRWSPCLHGVWSGGEGRPKISTTHDAWWVL